MTTAKEHPILFSGPLVRALLDGRKSQTRRVVRPQPKHNLIEGVAHVTVGMDPSLDGVVWYDADCINPGREVRCPFGCVGDRLWVRETFQIGHDTGEVPRRFTLLCETGKSDRDGSVFYRADGNLKVPEWRPSIFMPRWASRITLEITGVRVERLNAISEGDAMAEGIDPQHIADLGQTWKTYREGFKTSWDAINGKRPGCAWADNPWVWIIEFRNAEVTR